MAAFGLWVSQPACNIFYSGDGNSMTMIILFRLWLILLQNRFISRLVLRLAANCWLMPIAMER